MNKSKAIEIIKHVETLTYEAIDTVDIPSLEKTLCNTVCREMSRELIRRIEKL